MLFFVKRTPFLYFVSQKRKCPCQYLITFPAKLMNVRGIQNALHDDFHFRWGKIFLTISLTFFMTLFDLLSKCWVLEPVFIWRSTVGSLVLHIYSFSIVLFIKNKKFLVLSPCALTVQFCTLLAMQAAR